MQTLLQTLSCYPKQAISRRVFPTMLTLNNMSIDVSCQTLVRMNMFTYQVYALHEHHIPLFWVKIHKSSSPIVTTFTPSYQPFAPIRLAPIQLCTSTHCVTATQGINLTLKKTTQETKSITSYICATHISISERKWA